MKSLAEYWRTTFRVVVAVFWLYFASQKWNGVGWMKGLIQAAPAANPIPGLHEFLAVVVAPNWFWFALLQGIGETFVGVLLLLGIATRKVAVIGFLLALNLALVVAFEQPDPGYRWLYYLAVLVNAELIVAGAGALALGRWSALPGWARE